MDVAAALAIRFNERINAGDLEGLARMMSADHTFVDTAGTVPNPAAPQLAAPRAAVGLAGSPPLLPGTLSARPLNGTAPFEHAG